MVTTGRILLVCLTVLIISTLCLIGQRTTLEDSHHQSYTNGSLIILKFEYEFHSTQRVHAMVTERLTIVSQSFRSVHGRPLDIIVTRHVDDPRRTTGPWDVFVVLVPGGVHMLLDHAVIGGGRLADIAWAATGGLRTQVPTTNVLAGLMYLPRFIHCRPDSQTSKKDTLPVTGNVQRLVRDMYHMKVPGTSMRAAILSTVLSAVYDALPVRKPLHICMPVAFEDSYRGVNNNIGAIWFTYERWMDTRDLHDVLARNRYQAVSSNVALLYLPLGQSTRRHAHEGVDVVLSMTYSAEAMSTSCTWSFYELGEYPIYAAVGTCVDKDGHARSRLTVTTSTLMGPLDQWSNATLSESTGLLSVH